MGGPSETSAPSGCMSWRSPHRLPVISTLEPEHRMYWMPCSSVMLSKAMVQDPEGDGIDPRITDGHRGLLFVAGDGDVGVAKASMLALPARHDHDQSCRNAR